MSGQPTFTSHGPVDAPSQPRVTGNLDMRGGFCPDIDAERAKKPRIQLERWTIRGHGYDVVELKIAPEERERLRQVLKALPRLRPTRPGTPARRVLMVQIMRQITAELGWTLSDRERQLLDAVEAFAA